MDLVTRAARLAQQAHDGQCRKYTGEPYIAHPRNVAQLVSTVEHTPQMLAAAWLHDVVEDTDVEGITIFREFGPDVALYVAFLTDSPMVSGKNRGFRKRYQCNRLAAAPAAAKTIKLADVLDNASSILDNDPKFGAVFLREMEDLLPSLRGGDGELFARVLGIIGHYRTGAYAKQA